MTGEPQMLQPETTEAAEASAPGEAELALGILATTVAPAPATNSGPEVAAAPGNLRNGLDPRVDVEQLSESLAALAAARQAQEPRQYASTPRQSPQSETLKSEVIRIAAVNQASSERANDRISSGRIKLPIEDVTLKPVLHRVDFHSLVVELPALPEETETPLFAVQTDAAPAVITSEEPPQDAVELASAESVVPDKSEVAAPQDRSAPPIHRIAASLEQDVRIHRRLAIEARMMMIDRSSEGAREDASAKEPQRETVPGFLAVLIVLGVACCGVRTVPREG